jgi:hypothetical protein
MKCGTTALTSYLAAHPGVFISVPKELHFFDRNYQLGFDWYLSHFKDVYTETAVGESTAHYSYDESAHPRMARHLPDAKLILMVRDPVDRAYSQYWHARTRGRESLTFLAAIEAEAERLRSSDPMDRWVYSYVDRGYYPKQIKSLLKFYPKEALNVIVSEELRCDPVATYQSVCAFLGVDGSSVPQVVGDEINTFVAHRSTTIRRLSDFLPSGIKRVIGKLNRTEGSYPPMDTAARKMLTELYYPSSQELAAMIGKDVFQWWSKPK